MILISKIEVCSDQSDIISVQMVEDDESFTTLLDPSDVASGIQQTLNSEDLFLYVGRRIRTSQLVGYKRTGISRNN